MGGREMKAWGEDEMARRLDSLLDRAATQSGWAKLRARSKVDAAAWDEIERLGRQFGARDEAIYKWRQRGVSAKWQLLFVRHGCLIAPEVFRNPPAGKAA
jgi:hypothetical protein